MSRTRFAAAAASSFLAVVLAACGGGGHGFGVESDPIRITSTALPSTLSGQVVSYGIPYDGGSGGPYLLELIGGGMPDGVGTDGATVSLVGRALEDGVFDFTLKLTDSGSVPFSTTTASFHWDVGVGPLVFGTDAALPGVVFNDFTSIPLVVAGGVPPYSCEVVDLPFVADEPLPTGMSLPPESTTIVGAPQQAKPGGAPFLVTVRATDSTPGTPLTVDRTFLLPVIVPPIIITTLDVPDGKCGTAYVAKVDVADGVAPFLHSVVDPLTDIGVVPYSVATHRLRGEPSAPNGVPKGSFPSAYAADATAGPYPGRFPEGLFMRDATGDILGIPRRTGAFNDWEFHIQSTLLPTDPSQNRWKSFSFTMTEGVPPALALDPLVMPAGQGYVAPNNKIPDLEVGVSYSKSFAAVNGVPYDGKFDAPHETDAVTNPGEAAGKYDFSASTFQVAGRPANLAMSFSALGVFQTLSPAGVQGTKGGYESLNLVVRDHQLPSGLVHQAAGVVRYSIGPDTVVITETSAGSSSVSVDIAYDAPSQTVEILEPYTAAPTVRALASGDMAATHTNPTGTALSSALAGIDFLSVSVNPTWWAYDNYNLNAQGARGFQHADPERMYTWTDYANDGNYYVKNYTQYMPLGGMEHASNCATELPETTAVAHDPSTGVYADGGLLYGYDNPTEGEFGFFVVRKDSKIYVPFSMAKAGLPRGFGDCWISTSTAVSSTLRKPQITVSPDGRFGAAKIKDDVTNWLETSNVSTIVLFSLTGEKVFGGETWRVITTGASGTTSEGQYLYADSLTLTNRYLYYMTGNRSGNTHTSVNTAPDVMFREHWVWRYDLTRTSAPFAGARLAPSYNGNWTNQNTSSTAGLSTSWHRWAYPGGVGTNFNDRYGPSYGALGVGTSYAQPDVFTNHFANFAENSMAPTPFRVSRNGKAIAIVAAPNTFAGSTAGTVNFMSRYVFVDWDSGGGVDSAVFRQASGNTARRYRGASRIGGLRKADYGYMYGSVVGTFMAGWFDGPATQMEISDDGLKVAAVYNGSGGSSSWSASGTSNQSSSTSREQVVLFSAGNPGSSSDPWSSTAENDTITNGVFTGSLNWRFGCLAFTRDASAFVFWGGYSLGGGTTFSYNYVNIPWQSGSLYAYNILTNTRQGILNYGEGGHTNVTSGTKTYSTSTQNNYAAGNYTGDQGAVGPIGAFYSNDGKFYWVESHGSLATGQPTGNRLVGVNVSGDPSVAANTINGRVPLRAFAPSWPTSRGFGPSGFGYYIPFKLWGCAAAGARVMQEVSAAGHKGRVFYASSFQGTSSTTYDSVTSYYYGAGPAFPTYYYSYGFYAPEVYVIDTSVGGAPAQLTSLGGTTSPFRYITYLQTNRDGNRLAFVYNTPSTVTYPYYQNLFSAENLVLVTNIATNATTGTLTSATSVVLEPTAGRAGASMAFDFAGSALYYAFTTSGGENNQKVYEKKFDPTTGAVQSTRSMGSVSGGGPARFAVLNSGR